MKFNRLFGYDERTMDRVRENIIVPMEEGRFEALAPGYMFFGPPGTGKTAMIEAIATEARGRMRFIRLNMVEALMSSSSQDRFKEIIDRSFQRAKKAAPAFIYLDKPERIENSAVMEEMPVKSVAQTYIAEKLKEIRGDGICLLLEVQDPYDLDSGIFGAGRIEDMFHIDYPDEDRLRNIIERLIPGRVRKNDLERAVTILRGMSPADGNGDQKMHQPREAGRTHYRYRGPGEDPTDYLVLRERPSCRKCLTVLARVRAHHITCTHDLGERRWPRRCEARVHQDRTDPPGQGLF